MAEKEDSVEVEEIIKNKTETETETELQPPPPSPFLAIFLRLLESLTTKW